jgi:dihydropyrimidinase/dihydroorotase/allantoinase
MMIVDMDGETHITEATLLTNARAISRLTHGARYAGRIALTILRGTTTWDGTTVTAAPGTGQFVTPEGTP